MKLYYPAHQSGSDKAGLIRFQHIKIKALHNNSKRLTHWVLALGFVVIWYAVLQGISTWAFHVSLYRNAIPQDLLANLLLGALIYSLSRSLAWYLPAIASLMAFLHLANAGKVVVLGGPMMPDDVLAISNLFQLFDGWQLAGVILAVAIPVTLLVLALAWRSVSTWAILGLLAIVVWGMLQSPVSVSRFMDKRFGDTIWNQRGNFAGRGLLIHLIQESARYLARGENPPTQFEVSEALLQLQQIDPDVRLSGISEGAEGRNVHVIVLESFWDPMVLTEAGFSADPIDPAFRALWALSGNSRVLSPVFGGYTANAEFEVLCGFPVTEDAVFFEGWLRRDVPCLPRHLNGIGYQNIASHPNVAAFWNRVNAYRRIGFDQYWAKPDFLLDDMNRNFLGDASYYRQVLEKITPLLDGSKPVFNYMLTIFGHLDYPLNEARPAVIETTSDNKMVRDYANTMYYKSRELMAFLTILRAKDPDALIVLFGDHAPFLGPNFGGFTDSGLLADKRSNFDDKMFETLVTTPLIIIDGQKGPLELGEIPLYQLPAIILKLLGDQRPSLMQLAVTSPGAAVRPLPGMYFLVGKEPSLVCRAGQDKPDACQSSDKWLQSIITVTRDLFAGSQYILDDPDK